MSTRQHDWLARLHTYTDDYIKRPGSKLPDVQRVNELKMRSQTLAIIALLVVMGALMLIGHVADAAPGSNGNGGGGRGGGGGKGSGGGGHSSGGGGGGNKGGSSSGGGNKGNKAGGGGSKGPGHAGGGGFEAHADVSGHKTQNGFDGHVGFGWSDKRH